LAEKSQELPVMVIRMVSILFSAKTHRSFFSQSSKQLSPESEERK